MPSLGRAVVIGFVLIGICGTASAQVAEPSQPNWNVDLAGTIGVRPGLGATTTGVDVSGTVTLIRTTHSNVFDHRCTGLTAMFSAAPGERLMMLGPRWDAGDQEGTGFFRILGGVLNLTETVPTTNGRLKTSESLLAVGAGAGIAVGGVLLDVNWIMSPASERARHRLTVSAGYTWSVPFKRGS